VRVEKNQTSLTKNRKKEKKASKFKSNVLHVLRTYTVFFVTISQPKRGRVRELQPQT